MTLTPDQIKQHAQSLVNELGLSSDVVGVADERITGVSSGMKVKAEYEQILNDLTVLVRDLAETVAQLQVEKDTKLPQPGSLP